MRLSPDDDGPKRPRSPLSSLTDFAPSNTCLPISPKHTLTRPASQQARFLSAQLSAFVFRLALTSPLCEMCPSLTLSPSPRSFIRISVLTHSLPATASEDPNIKLWQLIVDLSEQLSQNRAVTAALQAQVAEIKVRRVLSLSASCFFILVPSKEGLTSFGPHHTEPGRPRQHGLPSSPIQYRSFARSILPFSFSPLVL